MSSEAIIKLAFELGDSIAHSEEIAALKAAQEKLVANQEAYELIMRYQEARMKAEQKKSSGLIIPSNEENHLAVLEQQLNSNVLVQELMKAQERFDNLMQAVYFAMNQAIAGDGCSGGCSSCDGSCGE
ncbi:YlbF family regulator [Thermosyntropha sp.]|uniref:YlbF family regulator n=1 Tax=Thermosyntropha sp. TaxID=2740820 RepID=UPI0025E6BB87|nr:YlbF family regulator [Thermosyntropha sp.]MBO8158376.1 YlbF family regulator [Thermosyntropha sp.]